MNINKSADRFINKIVSMSKRGISPTQERDLRNELVNLLGIAVRHGELMAFEQLNKYFGKEEEDNGRA